MAKYKTFRVPFVLKAKGFFTVKAASKKEAFRKVKEEQRWIGLDTTLAHDVSVETLKPKKKITEVRKRSKVKVDIASYQTPIRNPAMDV